MNEYPKDRLYSKEHEWLRLEGESVAMVGITYHAQDALGDIVYLSEPEVGREVSRGEEVAEIESVKAVSQIFSPVSGKIIEVNHDVIESPEIINEDPYERGWIFKIELSSKEELNDLMSAEAYQKFVEEG